MISSKPSLSRDLASGQVVIRRLLSGRGGLFRKRALTWRDAIVDGLFLVVIVGFALIAASAYAWSLGQTEKIPVMALVAIALAASLVCFNKVFMSYEDIC